MSSAFVHGMGRIESPRNIALSIYTLVIYLHMGELKRRGHVECLQVASVTHVEGGEKMS